LELIRGRKREGMRRKGKVKGNQEGGEEVGRVEGKEEGMYPGQTPCLLMTISCRITSAQKEEEVAKAGAPAKLTPCVIFQLFTPWLTSF